MAKTQETAVCERCGVEFDSEDYFSGAPCPDCQLEDPTTEYRKLNTVEHAEKARRTALVREWYDKRVPDHVIAKAIGLTPRQVVYERKTQGLPGHVFEGTELWTDTDAVRAKIAKASKRYWSDPNRKPRAPQSNRVPVGGVLTAKDTKTATDARYKGDK